jgi:hypothetical protein
MEYCEGGKLKNMPIGARRNSIEKSFSHLLLGLGNINARGYALRSVNILARKDGSLALREYEQGTLADGEKSVAHPPKNLSGGPVERARAGIRLLGRTLLGAFAGQGPGGAPENRGNQRDRISEELEEVKKYNPLLADALGLMCNSDLCRGPTTDDLLEYLEVRGKEPSLGNHWERLHASEIGHRELEERKRAERKVEDSSIRERRERAAEELVGLLLRISQDFIRDDDVAARLKG